MYPLKFDKYLVKKIWGGRQFQNKLNISLPTEELYGESWEVTCRQDGMSIVTNGKFKGTSILKLIEEYKEIILGKEIYEKFKGKFPLLIKYLDINDRLSVQVHPSDEYALRVEGEFGKSECWYIMEASEDATLILGVKDGITREEFTTKVKNKDFTNLFNTTKVKKGDFINLLPGVIHATLEGSILICEIQQNSDTTYRIYDFDRVVDGKLRELHLDKALDVIDFDGEAQVVSEKDREKIMISNSTIEKLVRGEYFNVDRILINGKYEDTINTSFKIYSILDGKGTIYYNKKKYPLIKGDTYFIPANLKIDIEGQIELLKSFI